MKARYLVRFDDICPTMNWKMWSRIETVLIVQGIKPLLAVIPDNQDERVRFDAPHPSFWEKVRAWQARGWTIGLHGYQHRFVTREAGILRIQRRSEFAGVAAADQREKLQRAVEIFRRHEVRPEVWIAPAHSFDCNTVRALKELGISTISDGFALAPHTGRGSVFWVPQQLWNFRWRPVGVWTVCYHHNVWNEPQFKQFLRDVSAYRPAITGLAKVASEFGRRRHSWLDAAYSAAHLAVLSWRSRRVSA